jgi:hypothetical protein
MDKPLIKFRLVFNPPPLMLKSAEYDIYPDLDEISQSMWTERSGMPSWPKISVPGPDRKSLYE